MDCSAVAEPRPPSPTSSSAITSLASNSRTKHQSSRGGISLAEALATSVADYVCGKKQRLINGVSSAINSATMTTTVGVDSKSSTRKIRLVGSAEQRNPAPDDATSALLESASSTSTRTVNRSSMSSAVADLASGMSIFCSGDGGARSGGGYCQHGNNCGSASAPIVSGTAAAVLALQNASCNNNSNYDNIVSSNSSMDPDERKMMIVTAASAVTEGRKSTTPTGPGQDVVVVALNELSPTFAACKSMTSENDDKSHSSLLSSSSTLKFHMRHSDGAPIIAGTAAAAQMKAIVTAAQMTNTTTIVDVGGGMTSNGDSGAMNSVAISRPRGDNSSNLNNGGSVGHDHYRRIGVGDGRAGETYQRHGFSSSGGRGGESGAAAAAATVTKQGFSALSWVDHRSNNTRITPDDESSSPLDHLSAYQAPWAISSTTSTQAGGMDLLAEITCHAPPLPLLSNLSHTSATGSTTAVSATNNINTYSQQNDGILSCQEIYYQAKSPSSSQEQYSQPHQALQHEQVPNERISPKNAKRVLAIPTYQEIYREMGISPEERHHPSQRHHSTCNYSVEEVPVDSYHLSSHQSESFHAHAIHHQNNDPPPFIDDPTKLYMSNQCQPNSRTPTAHFGHVNREDVEEGKELYTRKDLCRFGGHVSEAKDFHGNIKDGCDSLVVGNMVRPHESFDDIICIFC